MQFQASIRDPRGILKLVAVSADTESDALAKAGADGSDVLALRQESATLERRDAPATLRRNGFDPGSFAEEMSALLDAGLSIPEALQTLGSREPARLREAIYTPTQRALLEGKPLSAAMGAAQGRFPPLLVATVKASEHTGDMAESLRRYALTHKRVAALKEKVVSASIYPAILTVVGVVVLVFLLGVVVPRFAVLIDANGHDIPQASRLLMHWGLLVNHHLREVLGVGAGLVVLAALAATRPGMRAALAARAARLPVIGVYLRLYRQNQFWQTSAMLVEGGIPAPQAFRMAATLLTPGDRARVREALARIDAGQELAGSFNAAGLVDSVAYRMLQVGQKTGRLARALGQLASFQGEALERGIDRLTRLVEPLLMIVIGGIVGGIVVLMYMPIFDLASSIQ